MMVTTNRRETVRMLLRDAAEQLIQSRDLLLGSDPDYATGLSSCVKVIRKTLHAFLLWHSLTDLDDVPLQDLARHAVPLASILATPIQRALPLETLGTALSNKTSFTLSEREAAKTSYYTARNTFFTVLRALPERVQLAAGLMLPLGSKQVGQQKTGVPV